MIKKISLYLFIAATGNFLHPISQETPSNSETSLQEAQEFLTIKNKADALAFKKKHGEPNATEVTDTEMEYLEQIKKALQAQDAGDLKKAEEIFTQINK